MELLAPRAPDPRLRGRRVLVVDDDPLVGAVTAEYLKASGQAVDVVQNGLDAVARCRAERFDLVVTDQGMPDINGCELAGLVKAVAPRMLVVVLSGAGDPDRSSRGPTEAVDATLDKPLTMGALQTVLRRLNRRVSEARAA